MPSSFVMKVREISSRTAIFPSHAGGVHDVGGGLDVDEIRRLDERGLARARVPGPLGQDDERDVGKIRHLFQIGEVFRVGARLGDDEDAAAERLLERVVAAHDHRDVDLLEQLHEAAVPDRRAAVAGRPMIGHLAGIRAERGEDQGNDERHDAQADQPAKRSPGERIHRRAHAAHAGTPGAVWLETYAAAKLRKRSTQSW